MMLARKLQKFIPILSALLLCLTLVCAQGALLHIHYLDCDVTTSAKVATDQDHGHAQHARIHLVTDDSHHDHAKLGMSELDISPQGLLKNLTDLDILALALVFILTLVLPSFARQTLDRPQHSRLTAHSHYALSPPLRAPPLT